MAEGSQADLGKRMRAIVETLRRKDLPTRQRNDQIAEYRRLVEEKRKALAALRSKPQVVPRMAKLLSLVREVNASTA
jgi:hypothetical protein